MSELKQIVLDILLVGMSVHELIILETVRILGYG